MGEDAGDDRRVGEDGDDAHRRGTPRVREGIDLVDTPQQLRPAVARGPQGGLARVHLHGWHSLRRQFATELKTIPLPDLAELGGWKDTRTILTCYQRPDAVTMRKALDERERLACTGQDPQ